MGPVQPNFDLPPKGPDLRLADVWIEGPSGHEPGFHQSINVGDPFGEYESYSFGIDANMGSVYEDVEKGGEIQRYMKTTPSQDELANEVIKAQRARDNSMCYGPNTCRSYSQDKFETLRRLFDVQPSEPPGRSVAPRSGLRKVGEPTTTTGASGWFSGRVLPLLLRLSSSSSTSSGG